jgi:DNA-binding NtrC family response regulator
MSDTMHRWHAPTGSVGVATVSLADALPALALCRLTPVFLIGDRALAVAQELHRLTYVRRPWAPFVVVDCLWLPVGAAGLRLFGSDGDPVTRGYFDQANRGTLVLENLEYLPGLEQMALADLLDHMAFRRVGGLARIPVSLRVVAVTHESPEELAGSGRLRSALIRRLDVVAVRLP